MLPKPKKTFSSLKSHATEIFLLHFFIRHISIIYQAEGAVSFRAVESMENCS